MSEGVMRRGRTGKRVFVRSLDPEPRRKRTTCADHTVCPEGYLSWYAWAEKKARRHYQVQCDECGLWAIWRRKPKWES